MTHGLRILAIGFSLFCFCQAQAMESYYVVNQRPEKNFFEVNYVFTNGDFSSLDGNKASSVSNALAMSFRRSLENNQSVWIAGQMIDRKVHILTENTLSTFGIGDVQMGYKKGEVYDFVTAVYGTSLSLSPGMTQDPRLGRVQQVNNFSGAQSVAPYFGVEGYYGNLAIGSQFEVRLFSDLRYEDDGVAKTYTNPNRFVPKLKGFLEIPISTGLDWGMQVSVGRYNFAVDQLLFGGIGNEYEATMYGEWKIEPKMALLAMITSKDQKYPLPETSTDVSIGLRKEM